jgi:hypothetical protein
VKILTTLGFVFASLGWLWLAIRYFGKGDTIGGLIFLVTSVISLVLFIRQVIEKR